MASASVTSAPPPLLELRDLRVAFETPSGRVNAVDGVTLTIAPREIVALVGESGSGKTMTGLAIGRLLPLTARWSASAIRFDHHDLLARSEAQMRAVLGCELTYLFQDPAASLNPVLTIGEQLCEPLIIHRGLRPAEARAEAVRHLAAVQLADPAETLRAYPHHLSGGMQQRVMLAMAVALGPKLLIADEPTTALDVTVQAQMLALLLTVRREFGMAILLITHDLVSVAPIADRVAVMTAGRIVETAPTAELYRAPHHPHTRALLEAVPHLP